MGCQADLHSNHLGSLSEATTGSGGVSSRQRYFPYGRVRYSSGSPPTTYNFTGQRLDGTGLLYFQARYYDPTVGRFLSADTLVQADAKTPTPYLRLAVSYAEANLLERWNQLQRSPAHPSPQHPQPLSAIDPQSLNRYTYARNSPLAYIDRSGHIAWWVVGGVVGGVGGFVAYALTHQDNFDWGQAALWTAGGAVVGGTLGAGAQWVAGTLGATEAATTAGAAVTTAGATASSPAGQRTILWLEEQLPRVQHIMAQKHAWDRLVTLSGNKMQDYRTIQPFLRQAIESASRPEFKGMTDQGQRILEFISIVNGETIVVRVVELGENLYQISNAYVKTLP